MEERVQKIIAQWGMASRRKAEKMILAGRVKLNGQVVTLGQKANPKKDRLEIDGKLLKSTKRPKLLYILLNKPEGVVCTCHDPQGRKTVLGCLGEGWAKNKGLHPVGRLDFNSSGALLLTNDGELTVSLTHPRYHCPKTYEVWVKGYVSEAILQKWREGILLDGKLTLPAQIEVLGVKTDCTLLKIVLKEGRNRQIRRVAKKLGHPVISLHRSAIGSIKLEGFGRSLRPGEYCFLSHQELINQLYS